MCIYMYLFLCPGALSALYLPTQFYAASSACARAGLAVPFCAGLKSKSV